MFLNYKIGIKIGYSYSWYHYKEQMFTKSLDSFLLYIFMVYKYYYDCYLLFLNYTLYFPTSELLPVVPPLFL